MDATAALDTTLVHEDATHRFVAFETRGSRWRLLDAGVVFNASLPRDACPAQIELEICAVYIGL